jgi:SNF2 family DNA or RNA helicase
MIFEIINSTSNLDSNLDSKLEKQRLAFDKQVANLMNGTYVYAHKDTDKNNNKKVQKICIFSGYNETIEQIESALVEKGVSFLRLEGTSSKLANLIDEFRKNDSIKVLLINSNRKCSGLNIEFMTDLILFHKTYNESIEGQLIGRAQRIGRTSNLNVHYLLYNNEDK